MKQRVVFFGVLICATLFLCQVALAKRVGTYPNYSAAQLKALMDRGEDVFLLCPLSDIVFNEKHIPGSINIPSKQLMKTKQLPKDKGALIVTYCLGPK